MKDITITFRCSEKFKTLVKLAAEGEGLSLSAYITRLLKLKLNAEEINTRTVPKETLGKE